MRILTYNAKNVDEVMTKTPKIVPMGTMAVEERKLMRIISIQSILKAGSVAADNYEPPQEIADTIE